MPSLKLRLSCFILAIQFFSLWSYAQTDNKKFTRLTTSEGLSQNSVFAILKDYKGFMWFATDEGLNKYDGYKFTIYKHDPEKPGSILNNSILDILEDAAHNLWIETVGGLDRFDRTSEKFIHYNFTYNNATFSSLFQDSKHRLWLGSDGGLCLFDPVKNKYQFYRHNTNDSNSLSNDYVYNITEDDDGNLWIGTRKGLNRFNPETEKFTHYQHDPANKKSIGSGYIKAVYKDREGNIWAGTQGSGIAMYNKADKSFTVYKHDRKKPNSIGHNDILSFAEDVKGNLWIGTENGGISVFNKATNNFITYQYNESEPYSLSGNSIHSLYTDDIGNIWAGTWSDGISFLPVYGDKFTHFKKIPFNNNSLSNNLVLSINSDHQNNIWICTDGGGLNQFDPKTHNFKVYKQDKNTRNGIHNNFVLSAFEYLPGILALGFHRGGIDLFNIEKNQFTHYSPGLQNANSVTELSVNYVYRDSQHNLWLGTNDNGGIHSLDEKDKNFNQLSSDLAGSYHFNGSTIYTIHETKNGQLWFGGDKGLGLFDSSRKDFSLYKNNPQDNRSLNNNKVYALAEDRSGNLWVGTGGGLNYLDVKSKKFTAYTEMDGLPNNTVWGIQEDQNGNLWISTNKGLSKFDLATRRFKNFTISDGLQSNTFKSKACYQAPDGQMFFGGVNGFNTFYPDSIKYNDFIPPVYITGFQVFNRPMGIGGNSPLKKSINELKEIVLSYQQSVFTLEFSALNFTHPEQNQYAYMLEGFDKEWINSGNKRSATYTNLNPGTYTFKVKASNNDGIWNATGTSITIIIQPPFWLTWWFITLIFLLLAGAVIGFYRFRVAIIEKQKLLLEKKVREQTIQLLHSNEEERMARLEAEQSRADSELAREQAYRTNADLQIKNQELEQFAYVASHDLQEPLRTTTSFVKILRQQYHGRLDAKADKYLDFITDAADRMRVLIKDLLDFSAIGTKMELKNIDCNVMLTDLLKDIMAATKEANANIQFEELPQIVGYPTEIKLLFQNLLLNAIKFRRKNENPQIKISALKKQAHWQFAVSDNGIGIEEQYTQKIFDIFQRLHTRTEYQGSGIGLSHCKKIVELHRGKIWVESVPGEGSTFYFTILVQKAC